jgi:hypothetical protein
MPNTIPALAAAIQAALDAERVLQSPCTGNADSVYAVRGHVEPHGYQDAPVVSCCINDCHYDLTGVTDEPFLAALAEEAGLIDMSFIGDGDPQPVQHVLDWKANEYINGEDMLINEALSMFREMDEKGQEVELVQCEHTVDEQPDWQTDPSMFPPGTTYAHQDMGFKRRVELDAKTATHSRLMANHAIKVGYFVLTTIADGGEQGVTFASLKGKCEGKGVEHSLYFVIAQLVKAGCVQWTKDFLGVRVTHEAAKVLAEKHNQALAAFTTR